jgi:hypothetical protein
LTSACYCIIVPGTITSTITTTASVHTVFLPVSTDTIVSIVSTESSPITVETISILTTVSTYVVTDTETSTIISESTDVVSSTSTDIIISTDTTETFYSVAVTDTVTTTVTTTTTTSVSETTTTTTVTVSSVFDLVFGPAASGCFLDSIAAAGEWYEDDVYTGAQNNNDPQTYSDQFADCLDACLGSSKRSFTKVANSLGSCVAFLLYESPGPPVYWGCFL